MIHATKRRRRNSRVARTVGLLRYLPLRSFPVSVIFLLGILIGIFISHTFFSPQPWEASTTETPAIQVCFSPEGNCTVGIVDAINNAKASIDVQAFSFTSEAIAQALVEAKHRGVDVNVILDRSQLTAKGSQLPLVLQAQIPVMIDNVSGIAHNKIIILDEARVITGSFNFSNSADFRNAENVLLLSDPNLAQIYKANWKRRAEKAQRVEE